MQIVALALVAAGAMTITQPVTADNRKCPYRPIRIVQGFSSGGVSDVLSRVIGDNLGPRLGQAIVVEARPGGGGIVGMTFVANETPDGYTLRLGNSAITVSPNRTEKPPFDTLTMFAPVSMIGTAPSILLVNPAGREEVGKSGTFRSLGVLAGSEPRPDQPSDQLGGAAVMHGQLAI